MKRFATGTGWTYTLKRDRYIVSTATSPGSMNCWKTPLRPAGAAACCAQIGEQWKIAHYNLTFGADAGGGGEVDSIDQAEADAGSRINAYDPPPC
jgi:hypothetical protein